MKRLLKEVIKIKDVLSANKQMQVKIGELQDYVSLITTVERKDFEEQATAFFDRVAKPVDEVLAKAGLTIDQVDLIELVGGGIRVPKLQEILQATLQKSELGVHMNGDEAMCFGAAFIAANSSASFKVRKVFLTQHPNHEFQIKISPVNSTIGDNEEKAEMENGEDSESTS